MSTSWPMYNQTYEGVRYSSLQQINADNVRQMRQICALRLREVGPFQTGPVVIGTTVYVTTAHDTYAMNAQTCGVIWHNVYTPTGYEPFLTNHGVAVADGRVFRGTTDGHLLALDSQTGKVNWNVQPAASQKGEWLSAAPIVWQGRAFIGTAGSDWGIRGRVMAFDAVTGRQTWSFSEIPVGESPGAETWGRASSTVTGGGGTWSIFTLDPATGELFIPVANPAPDLPGDYRPGANLFTDSIVVLDARSGRLRWWYQATPHDTHDWDVAAAPVLYADANGRRLVAFADKAGYFYALDRASHKLVFKVVTTTHKNDQQAPTQAGVHTCPGGLGGTEWNGPALDSPNDVLIVGAVDWCSTYTLGKAQYVAGQLFFGGTFGFDPIGKASGWLTAVDGSTGRIR